MKDLIAWFGLKRFPFDKSIKPADLFLSEPLRECLARLDYIKRRGGILLLTGDPGVGKTLAMRHFVNSLNENLFKPFYTPLSTLSRADLLYHINRLLGLTPDSPKVLFISKSSSTFLTPKNRLVKPSS
jgi:type II secretory pathway predicted ATPase ExeA